MKQKSIDKKSPVKALVVKWKIRTGPFLALLLCFAVALIAALGGNASSAANSRNLESIEVGRVADRDIIAERSLSYVDEESTRLRREAQEKLVPAVFVYSDAASEEAVDSFSRFSTLAKARFKDSPSLKSFSLAIQVQYPGEFSPETLEAIYRNANRLRLLEAGEEALRILLSGGIFSLTDASLSGFNPDVLELERKVSGRTQSERLPLGQVVTLKTYQKRLAAIIGTGSFPSNLTPIASDLLAPFVVENAFYSSDISGKRLEDARAKVEPVAKKIERGELVIRRNALVTREDLARVTALGESQSRGNPAGSLGTVILLAFIFALALFLTCPRVAGRRLTSKEVYLITMGSALFLVAASLVGHMRLPFDCFPSSIFLPTALLSMLLAVLVGPRVATAIAIVLPIGAFASGSFDEVAFFFALISGGVGAFLLQRAERRMDLIKDGAILGLAQILATVALLLVQHAPGQTYAPILFWAGFNGLVCGMTVLAILPLLEHAMNAATTFRLIELSDLNSPLLKRLLTSAPGTYSHSVTVANLAESACRAINANAILARVGAYYHDIGKMDQPDYFIENQVFYNKHDEIAPRLSATVIRSHVKVGIEKARRLGLPQEVVDIIAEHHGNSVISWFYNEALKTEDQVNAEDFSYPGSPPRSRESAVVMLADTVEAAVRTLKKPTMSRLDKFVHELIMSKFEQGQLAKSELTFRDLESIQNAFVRVLAGHYHSRIEYPNRSRESVQ